VTLEDLAAYPIINLDASFTGGAVVIRAFEAKGLTPNIVLNATDADVMKAYVAEGLGIGTLPNSVFDAKRDRGIRAIAVDGLFEKVTTSIVLLRDLYLRRSLLQLIEMLSPVWTREAIERAMAATTRG
jgi:LysR family transcriptional regulator, cys regulon transcriptional activator